MKAATDSLTREREKEREREKNYVGERETERESERGIEISVTRFGEISQLWQYFSKAFINFVKFYLVFGKILNLLGDYFIPLGQF